MAQQHTLESVIETLLNNGLIDEILTEDEQGLLTSVNELKADLQIALNVSKYKSNKITELENVNKKLLVQIEIDSDRISQRDIIIDRLEAALKSVLPYAENEAASLADIDEVKLANKAWKIIDKAKRAIA